MNIFKVLVSGKKPFFEEYASSFIAWLLNPRMEHGLGFVFLSRLIEDIALNNKEILDISRKLSPRLRTNDEEELKWACHLEYNVETAFVDIVLHMDDWTIAIENKIYASSASDQDQLKREYMGLMKKQEHKKSRIGMIFLVPVDDNGVFNPLIDLEYSNLEVGEGDFKSIVTWQTCEANSSGIDYPSISKIIVGILEDEGRGIIEPIPEYTRHTLKAFNQFILNNFSGYDFDSSSGGGINPLTENQYKIEKLKTLQEGYVGIKNGLSGLLQMDNKKLLSHKFQYSTADMQAKRQWLGIDTFNKVIDWRLHGTPGDINWDAKLPASVLYDIARDFGQSVFIGIRGGENALRQMNIDEIKSKRWSISSSKGSPNWIEGNVFYNTLKDKGWKI